MCQLPFQSHNDSTKEICPRLTKQVKTATRVDNVMFAEILLSLDKTLNRNYYITHEVYFIINHYQSCIFPH